MKVPARILVVDDDPVLQRLTVSVLALAGHEVLTANTGQQAFEVACREQPDLILLDVVLAGENGLEICRRLKGEPALAGSFVVLMSGLKTQSDDQASGLEAGADGYITRPISNRELQARMEALLRIKRAEAQVARLNRVLQATTSINQLIVREQDRAQVIEGVCDLLVETESYRSAWVALFDSAGGFVMAAESGWGEAFLPLAQQLQRGEWPPCGARALAHPEIVTIDDPILTCAGCPLAPHYDDRGGMVVRLEHGGRVRGLLCVSLSAFLIEEKGERGLLQEVAADLALALHNIEAEEERQRVEEELRRWHDLTLDRETRILELKGEVNELLLHLGEPIRYPSVQDL